MQWDEEMRRREFESGLKAEPVEPIDLPPRGRRSFGIMLLGLTGAFVALVLIGLLMAIPFLVRRDAAPGSSFQLGDLRARPEIVTDGDGRYLLSLQFTDVSGAATDPKSLNVSLAMDGPGMPPGFVALERTAIGAYRAQGSLAMVGRWRFRVESDRGSIDVVANYARSF